MGVERERQTSRRAGQGQSLPRPSEPPVGELRRLIIHGKIREVLKPVGNRDDPRRPRKRAGSAMLGDRWGNRIIILLSNTIPILRRKMFHHISLITKIYIPISWRLRKHAARELPTSCNVDNNSTRERVARCLHYEFFAGISRDQHLQHHALHETDAR